MSVESVINHADDLKRLAALCALNILDTEPEAAYDAIVKLVSELLEVPIAAVSLVDTDREWFKARVGTPACQGDRKHAFCNHTILDDQVLFVEDTALDSRFEDNPQVTHDGIRFYIGVPLHAPNGERVGALCAKDRKPRQLNTEQLTHLRRLAVITESLLGSRQTA